MSAFFAIGLYSLAAVISMNIILRTSWWLCEKLHIVKCDLPEDDIYIRLVINFWVYVLVILGCGFLAFALPSFPAALWMLIWWIVGSINIDTFTRWTYANPTPDVE